MLGKDVTEMDSLLLVRCTSMIILLGALPTYAQIKSLEVSGPQLESKYDSAFNFMEDFPELYVGTTLFLPGKPISERRRGYSDFRTKKEKIYSDGFVYKCCAKEDKTASKYEGMAGSSFTVLASDSTLDQDSAKTNIFILTLKNQKDASIAYYRYVSTLDYDFPFIDMRHFEWLKAKNVGQSFVVKGNSFEGGPIIDVQGYAFIDAVESQIWKCIDVIIEERFFKLSLLLENKEGRRIVFAVDHLNDPEYILTKEKAESIAHERERLFRERYESIEKPYKPKSEK